MTLKDVVSAWLWPFRGNSRLNRDTLWNDAIRMFSLPRAPPPKEAVRAGMPRLSQVLTTVVDDTPNRLPTSRAGSLQISLVSSSSLTLMTGP